MKAGLCIPGAAFAFLLLSLSQAAAHEVRPALLQLTELSQDRYEMLWRVPARGGKALPLDPRLPESCRELGPPRVSEDAGRFERSNQLICSGGLAEAAISIAGLERLRTDVLIRVSYLNGGSETHRAVPQAPSVQLAGKRDLLQIAGSYLVLGAEHILLGIDHLLFVFALLLLVRGWRRLIGTVTAFTLAHSITLAGATLGYVRAPAALIEPLIALSIVLVAAEVIHLQRGKESLTAKRPWLIAFLFGLLHGFGFAGALSAVGLPAEAVPTALLFFNIGVEVGQILFIAALALLARPAIHLITKNEAPLRLAAAGAIGILAGFWTVERVAAIWI